MAEIVRYANEHGMYFSGSSLPRMSSARRSIGVSTFNAGIPSLECIASIAGESDVESWRDNAKTIDFVVVMTVWGQLVPEGLAQPAPRRIRLAIDWNGTWVDEWLGTVSAEPAIAMQNDPATNGRMNFHALYTLSGCGSRLATSSSPFNGFVDIEMTDLSAEHSTLNMELAILDIVRDTTGL